MAMKMKQLEESLGSFKTIDGARNAYNNFVKNNGLEDKHPLSI